MGMFAYRLALFCVATLAFVTLFDHGPVNFSTNSGQEFSAFTGWLSNPFGH